MNSNDILKSEVIEAAGGLLWKETAAGRKLAIIHRPQYNDWTLPKGKREVGESWQETALREIFEETGCKARIEAFAGGIVYQINSVPKVVLFWHMSLVEKISFIPNDEIDKCEWLHPETAITRLNYKDERDILKSFINAGG
jgi:8-oxo-dGTP pyrophosphatase MutT (NUDIX family)